MEQTVYTGDEDGRVVSSLFSVYFDNFSNEWAVPMGSGAERTIDSIDFWRGWRMA
jgi:hypothetical protein